MIDYVLTYLVPQKNSKFLGKYVLAPGERGGGNKMSVLVHAQGIKTVHAKSRGQKMAKLYPRSC